MGLPASARRRRRHAVGAPVAATLACPVGPSLIMWMMGGHGRTHRTIHPISGQIDELGAEIERLKAEGTTDSRSEACDVGMARHDKPERHGMWRRAPNRSTILVRRK